MTLSKSHQIELVILDRDGVINVEQGHITSIEQFKILDGVCKAIALLNQSGIKVCVASNQSGLARGILSEKSLAEIQQFFETELKIAGGHIDHWFYSPWHPDTDLKDGVPKWLGEHEDRKPGVGMLNKALAITRVNVSNAIMVGDSAKDAQAAASLNMQFYGIKSSKFIELDGEKIYASLLELVDDVLS